MTGVERVRVGDVLRIERRAVNVDPVEEYREIGVRSFGRGIFHKPPLTGAEIGPKRVFRIEPGDLVISNVFAWEGAIAVAGNSEKDLIGSHRFMTFVATDERLDVAWARWFFLSDPGLALIRSASPGSAGRNKTLAIKRFEDLVIPLPSIDEQRRVSNALNAASDSAFRATELASRGSVLKDAAISSLAGRPDLSEDHKRAAGWRRTTLSAVMTQARDRVSVDPSASYPNLGIRSFGRGVFSKTPINGSETSASFLFRVRSRQFIYSRLFAFEGAYSYVPDEFDGYFVSNEFPTFDLDPEVVRPEWLAAYLRAPARWAEFATSSVGLGVRRQRVPVEAVLTHSLLLPPLEFQLRAARAISAVEHLRAKSTRVDEKLGAAVPSLVNRAFRDFAT